MAFYSSGDIKSEIIEPSVHNSGDRTEFRIHGDVLSSIKLVNVGRFGNAGTSYLDDVGVLGSIKSLFIYDGRTLLTGLRDMNEHAAFRNLQGNNEEHSNIDRLLKKHNIGYTNQFKNDNAKFDEHTNIKNANAGNFSATDVQTNTNRGYIQLREFFNMLQQVPVLSDKLFSKGLRVVLEYEQSNDKFQKATNITDTLNCRPLLVVDRVMNSNITQSMLSSLKNVNWIEHEREQFNLPAVTAGNTVPTSQKLNGFTGKTVGRLRVQKTFAASASNQAGNVVTGYGAYASHVVKNEVVQVKVNGRNLFARAGLEGKNRILAHLNDSFGELNLKEDDHQILNTGCSKMDNAKRGQKAYFGTVVGEKCNDLEITITRTGIADTNTPSRYLDAMIAVVECEVSKSLMVSGGSYMIGYN